MAPMGLERHLHFRRDVGIAERKDGGEVIVHSGLEVFTGKTETGKQSQFLEVMGTNVLVNEVVRHFSNSAAQGVGKRQIVCFLQTRFWENLLTLTHQRTCFDDIFKIRKAR